MLQITFRGTIEYVSIWAVIFFSYVCNYCVAYLVARGFHNYCVTGGLVLAINLIPFEIIFSWVTSIVLPKVEESKIFDSLIQKDNKYCFVVHLSMWLVPSLCLLAKKNSWLFSSIGPMSWWNVGIFHDFYHSFTLFILVPFNKILQNMNLPWFKYTFLVWNVLRSTQIIEWTSWTYFSIFSLIIIPIELFK